MTMMKTTGMEKDRERWREEGREEEKKGRREGEIEESPLTDCICK